MTKILHTLLFLLLVAVLLGGCQGKSPAPQEYTTPADAAHGDTAAQEQLPKPDIQKCAVVGVVINPELDVYVDGEGYVWQVVCKNEDAAKACEGWSWEGVSFDAFLRDLLSCCAQKGYLQAGDDVSLTVAGPVTPAQEQEILRQADTAMTEFAVQEQMPLSLVMQTPSQGVTASGYTAIPLPPNAQKEYDAQGNLVGYREVMSDGAVEVVTMDAAGNIIRRERREPNGSLYIHDGHDVLLYSRENRDDGSVCEATYTQDGVIDTLEDQQIDGSRIVITHNSGGLQERYEHYDPAGALIAQYTRVYHSTSPQHYTETNMIGEATEVWCDAQGQTQRTRQTGPDGVVTQWEFQNGEVVRELRLQPDGVQMEREIVNGEPNLERWTAPDGETWQVHYENGVVVRESGMTARGTSWSKRYSGGSMYYHRTDDADGSFMETRYEGGHIVYHASFKVGYNKVPAVTTSRYNGNGTLAFQSSTGPDGSLYEQTCNGNGKPVSWRMVSASGVETKGTFDANGNPVEDPVPTNNPAA